ncbi:MAG: endolytic transglycosylase MltG, partial [Acidobacteria bacterium]|nr:endolytic transglycosylase MltG [Acidobacteriota bacterium]
MKKLLLVLVAAGILAAAGASFYLQRQLQIPGNPAAGLILEIPRGMSASDIVRLLAEKNVIGSRYAAHAYIFYSGNRQKLQAGEYLFDRPMRVSEVVGKLSRGEVYLHKFTVPEGLTIDQIARKWQEEGFGKTEEFSSAATGAIDLVRDLDERAESVEGYLFPETYLFPSRTAARQVVEAMIGRFREMAGRLRDAVPASGWPLSLHETVVLASLIETEAARAEERPVIASVYMNRLKRRLLLQCDPTVIYALQQAGK